MLSSFPALQRGQSSGAGRCSYCSHRYPGDGAEHAQAARSQAAQQLSGPLAGPEGCALPTRLLLFSRGKAPAEGAQHPNRPQRPPNPARGLAPALPSARRSGTAGPGAPLTTSRDWEPLRSIDAQHRPAPRPADAAGWVRARGCPRLCRGSRAQGARASA